MDNNFVVYAHFTKDTNKLFYIGEGRPKRAYERFNRNKHWENTILKHNGFKVVILFKNLTKSKAEEIETNLISDIKSEQNILTNVCIGPMYKNPWILNTPKEQHPMYGKKSPNASKRMIQWNKEHKGELSPVYGLKRLDLIERNKLKLNKKATKKVICIETEEIFNSIKEASLKFSTKSTKIHLALKDPSKTWRKLHWSYLIEYKKLPLPGPDIVVGT